MKFIDWFAGIGGFRRGMELVGHECVGFCEFDKFASASYRSMHTITDEQREYLATLDIKKRQKEILKEEYLNGEWYANDIRRVYAEDIPQSDCWCFGFPCQDISVAGKQCGFTGNRSSLFFRVMYLVERLEEEKRPTYLFIENVKNLLSVNGGWDFARLLIALDEAGYDAEWQILNSKDFGVPQNRERCFIIGHLRGRGGSEVFPVEGTDGENHIYGVGHRNGYRRNMQVFSPEGITETLDTGQGGGRGHHTIQVIGKTRESKIVDRTRILSSDGINNCLRSTDYKDPTKVAIPISFANDEIKKEIETAHCLSAEGPAKEGMRTHQSTTRVAIPVLTPDRAEKRQNGRRFKEDGEESYTLTAQDRHGVAVDVNPQVIGGVGEKNFGKQWRQGNRVYDGEKIATALEAHPVGNTGGNTNLYAVDVTGYNATSKAGGGLTETANALMARDYKGLGNQTMTTAMICFSSTKESEQTNEKLQTALQQEKTEDSADTLRKEH